MAELELETIRHALGVAARHGFSQVALESGESSFSAVLGKRKSPPAHSSAPAPHAESESPSESRIPITAVCVGFYQPTDGALSLGRQVEQGEIVATIAALGLANDVESPVSGEIVEVLVEPDQPVQFGQPLAYVQAAE
jgi:acetyl-CoA carboxylase biotin carboxyl carrier protein